MRPISHSDKGQRNRAFPPDYWLRTLRVVWFRTAFNAIFAPQIFRPAIANLCERIAVTENREGIALLFVNALVPGQFEKARHHLSPDARYAYNGEELEGDAIIQSFVDNHTRAAQMLDSIIYTDGIVQETQGNRVTILVQDRLQKGQATHVYSDRLVIEVENQQVISVTHLPFTQEKLKLKQWFIEHDIE